VTATRFAAAIAHQKELADAVHHYLMIVAIAVTLSCVPTIIAAQWEKHIILPLTYAKHQCFQTHALSSEETLTALIILHQKPSAAEGQTLGTAKFAAAQKALIKTAASANTATRPKEKATINALTSLHIQTLKMNAQ
jgi:hypothetical protein